MMPMLWNCKAARLQVLNARRSRGRGVRSRESGDRSCEAIVSCLNSSKES